MQAHVFFHEIITYVLIFLAIAMAAMILWFIIGWRKRKDDPVDQKQTGKNFKIEPAWIVVPFLAVMIVISWGCRDYTTNWHAMMMRGHAMMNERAANDQDYDKSIEGEKEGVSLSPVELGKQVYSYYGCSACHSVNGRAMTGPSWKGLFGSTRVLSDNSEVVADENYIRTSIVSPAKQVVKGYGNVMPSFAYLSDKQIEGVIAYIKTLK